MNTPPPPPLPPPVPAEARRVTVADAVYRVAHDGPIYALFAFMSVLAYKGGASATELVITGALGLVARSTPPGIRGILTGAGALFCLWSLSETLVFAAP